MKVSPGQVGGAGENCPVTSPEEKIQYEQGQVENAEVRKPKYGNGNVELKYRSAAIGVY